MVATFSLAKASILASMRIHFMFHPVGFSVSIFTRAVVGRVLGIFPLCVPFRERKERGTEVR